MRVSQGLAPSGESMLTFGPVPSRRLGRSLGINNIPSKSCTYSCVYCQVGPTHRKEIEPRAFYSPDQIRSAVGSRLEAAFQDGEHVDYLTFVPDGEPTLDENLGKTIKLLRTFGVKIAVISNASLIWREDVRERLAGADWLSLKVDSTDEILWQRINQPHPDIELQRILEGIQLMAAVYRGVLATETMLVDGVNDSVDAVAGVSEYLAQLQPLKAYLAVPTRPTAEVDIHPPAEEKINRAFQLLRKRVSQVECLIGYEGDSFASTRNLVDDLLSIASVHPLREEAVKALLTKSGSDWDIVSTLVDEGKLKITEYAGKRFYVRTLRQSKDD